MERYVSEPFEMPGLEDAGTEFRRADLVFYGVDHTGPTYEARIFVNNPDADLSTPVDAAQGYAGSFTVFGHGGCYGEEGHCDPTERTTDPFDLRPEHPLTPQTKTVIVTDAVRPLWGSPIVVTVVAVVAGEDGAEATDALAFERIRLFTYE